MTRGAISLVATALLGLAPYQCKSNDADRAREETLGEALWLLCGRFAAAGDDEGARRTLDYLMERYPASREAKRAKDEREAPHPCAGLVEKGSPKASASAAASP